MTRCIEHSAVQWVIFENMRQSLLLIYLLLLSNFVYSQNRANVWYFGGDEINPFQLGECVGLDFNSGSPVLKKDGNMYCRESAASICDENGKLLFYTSGITVLNADHDTMPNGSNLKADVSTTQGSLIVPHPGNPNLYYLFTLDREGQSDGLKYNIIDMRLDGGRGDVSIKNKDLISPLAEKMTAVHHQNGVDIWLVVHGFLNNSFYSYLITENGLNETPVETQIGPKHGLVPLDLTATIGNMKLSHCGNFIACGRFYRDTIELYRFDNSSGIVCDYLPITSPSLELNFHNDYGYEFSPDDSKLYVGTFQGGQIFQLTLTDYTIPAIRASVAEIGRCNCLALGDLQLGPDGNIYVTDEFSGSIGVIENPNNDASNVNYIRDAILIDSTQTLTLALPDFVQSLVFQGNCNFNSADTNGFLGNDTTLCVNETLLLDATQSNATYKWQDGSTNSTFLVTREGKYWVDVMLSECIRKTDTILVMYDTLDTRGIVQDDTAICPGDQITINASSTGQVSYEWDNGSQDSVRIVNNSGEYRLSVSNGICTFLDTILVTYIEEIDINLVSDTTICDGSSLFISLGNSEFDILWSDGTTSATKIIRTEGVYKLTAETACETVEDSINVHVMNCNCWFHLPNAFSPDNNQINDFYKPTVTCDLTEFHMMIYNRWGQLLFQTDDPNVGWDGYYQNVLSETGFYMVIATYRSDLFKGERKFMFHLMR